MCDVGLIWLGGNGIITWRHKHDLISCSLKLYLAGMHVLWINIATCTTHGQTIITRVFQDVKSGWDDGRCLLREQETAGISH